MKLRKLLKAFFMLSVVCIIAACTVHEHTYSTDWSGDDKNHWHQATCEHKNATEGKEAHTWDGGSVVTESTCSVKGTKKYTCTVCGYEKIEEMALAEEHVWDHGVVTNAATCGAAGEKLFTCTLCSETKTEEVSATELHTWDDGVVTKNPTCTTLGETTYTCSACNGTKTEEIEMLEHDYETTLSSDADKHWYQCKNCEAKTEEADHTSNDGVVTKPATCLEAGEMTYSCTVCGEILDTEEIEILKHVESNIVIVEPTCAENGSKTYTCSLCLLDYTVELEATGHTSDEGTVTAPTCTEAGEKVYVCTECGEVLDTLVLEATGHNCANYTFTAGYSSFACTVCNEVVVEECLTADAWQGIDTASITVTVNNDGTFTVKFTTTGRFGTFELIYGDAVLTKDSFESITGDYRKNAWYDDLANYVYYEGGNSTDKPCWVAYDLDGQEVSHTYAVVYNPTDNSLHISVVDQNTCEHMYNAGVVTKEATCEEAGVKTYTCVICGSTKTEATELAEHTSNSGEITKAATCLEIGVKTYSCSVCGEVLSTEEIELAGHTEDEGEITKAATCLEYGIKTYSCSVCGEVIRNEQTPLASHTAGEDAVIINATCIATGSKTYTCTVCEEEVTEELEIDLNAHEWNDGEITSNPTCSVEGLKTYTCILCSDTKTETVDVDPTNHDYTELACDKDNHWYECVCGEKAELLEHNWNDGEVYNEISDVYTCTVCSYQKYDITNDDLTAGVDATKYGLAIRTPEDRELKIAQFADVHYGEDGRDWHNFDVARTNRFMTDVIERDRPDLIVCSGDNIIGTGVSNSKANEHDLIEFVQFIDSFGIPWIFMYGNHDAETKVKKEYSDYLINGINNGTIKNLLYQEEYIEVVDKTTSSYDQGRYGNYSVQILNPMGDQLIGSIIMFDAGTYLYNLGVYQTITEGQIAWYEQKINSLQAIYSTQEGNEHEIIPTIVFSHIQLPQHKTGYSSAYKEDGLLNAEFVIRQDSVASGLVDKNGGTDSGLFAKMVELGSTKAYFVGHAHTYKFQVKVDGIVLGYAPITGISKLDGDADLPREIYYYSVASDFSFTTKAMEERITEPSGLTYSYFGLNDENTRIPFTYDKTTGKYYAEINMIIWSRVRLRYNGVILTPENTNIEGAYSGTTNVSNNLYLGKNGDTFYNGTGADGEYTKYLISYDPLTNTLSFAPVKDFSYSGYQSGTVKLNPNDMKYTFEAKLPQWKSLSFTYNGTQLNASNTTITGFFNSSTSNDGTVRLYTDSDANVFLTGNEAKVTYKISYDPVTNELNFGIAAVNDIVLNETSGLVYTGTKTGRSTYNQTTNTYTFDITLDLWNSVELFYNGEVVEVFNSDKVDLTNNTTTLYKGAPSTKIVNKVAGLIYRFTYTPATESSLAKLVLDKVIEVNKVNADAGADGVSVWTTAGTNLKTVTDASNGTSSWIGAGWRTYIVCDSEGKIAYLVQFPTSGFGGPNAATYYCHSSYSDYTTNPSFKLLEGYGPYVSGGYVHQLYEVVVPEGGFAITLHGTAIDELYDALGVLSSIPTDDPDTANTKEDLKYINSRTFLSDDVRISYDATNGYIIVSK